MANNVWKLLDSDGHIVEYDGMLCSGYTNTDEGNVVFSVPKNEDDGPVVYTLIMYDEDDPSCSGKSTVTVPACTSSDCNCDNANIYLRNISRNIPAIGASYYVLAEFTASTECSNSDFTVEHVTGDTIASITPSVIYQPSPYNYYIVVADISPNTTSSVKKETFRLFVGNQPCGDNDYKFEIEQGICSCNAVSKFPGGEDDSGYIPVTGTAGTIQLATISNSCGNITYQCDSDWIRDIAFPTESIMIGYVTNNSCSGNRKATITLTSEAGSCGEVEIYQLGEGITDVFSIFPGEEPKPGEDANYAPNFFVNEEVGSFKAKKDCEVEVAIAPQNCDFDDDGWITKTFVEKEVYDTNYSIYRIKATLTQITGTREERCCELVIKDKIGGYAYPNRIRLCQSRRS